MRVDGTDSKQPVRVDDPDGARPAENGADLLPDPAAAVALRMGDVGATIAALILRGDRASRESVRQERELAERREADDDEQQLRQRANEILITGLATGLVKAGSGALAAGAGEKEIAAEGFKKESEKLASAGADAKEIAAEGLEQASEKWASAMHTKCGRELGSKVFSAFGDATKAIGESREAKLDVGAKEAERAAKFEQRRADDAKDSQQQLAKLASDVVEFLREFERTIAAGQSAILNRA
jgi:hypothetical protein